MELSLENTAFSPHLFLLNGAGVAIQSETSAATDISRETCGRSEKGLARCALIGKLAETETPEYHPTSRIRSFAIVHNTFENLLFIHFYH